MIPVKSKSTVGCLDQELMYVVEFSYVCSYGGVESFDGLG